MFQLDQHQTGGLECLGQFGTWVSGQAIAAATLVGQWANIIQCFSANQRIECKSANKRIECFSENERV